MTTDWTDRLSEYLDGTLSSEDARACESWLASNATGRELVEELRRVVARAKTLPDVAVPASIWPGVAAAIRAASPDANTRDVIDLPTAGGAAPRHRWTFTPVQFAAAAIVVLAVGLAGGLAIRSRSAGTEVAVRPFPGVTTVTKLVPVASRANESYDHAVDELQGILDRNRSSLDTSTVRVLESSLAKIDAALGEAQQALSKDPHNAYLIDHLTRIKRKKLDLLRQGASLVQAS